MNYILCFKDLLFLQVLVNIEQQQHNSKNDNYWNTLCEVLIMNNIDRKLLASS